MIAQLEQLLKPQRLQYLYKDHSTVTLSFLKEAGACYRGIQFVKECNLEGFPFDKVDQIRGVYLGYKDWLIDAIEEYNDGDIMHENGYITQHHGIRYIHHDGLIRTITPDGSQSPFTTYEYDGDDGKKLVKLTRKNEKYLHTIVYDYDGDTLVSVRCDIAAGEDKSWAHTTISKDKNNTIYLRTSSDSSDYTITTDEHGNCIEEVVGGRVYTTSYKYRDGKIIREELRVDDVLSVIVEYLYENGVIMSKCHNVIRDGMIDNRTVTQYTYHDTGTLHQVVENGIVVMTWPKF